ncbi:uncharacterized protein C6orf106 homolog [Mizuhopecten yessoensis]|uniref:Nbr1 FW domain-containing protein n=1 Tax=Mizuhopecten yessoensis TaxID=6573 RepID=A0A210Q893_MIZYE|nr:uncharacterized protein C6orf106 homolog [Mizuhopecten yessoensis]OWF44958.1 hypothetical protein KP79_PYT18107 [Mizuhopecten yessoensis]
MDVDNDIDGKLLQQFSSMGTTDREVLISDFQKLLGPNQLTPAGCAFFLDMNNWNLQGAIGSYFEYDQPNVKLPSMTFIMDVTVGEGEAVPPDTTFIKTWRIQNTGDEQWPPGCNLMHCSGENLSKADRVMVEALQSGQVADVSIHMYSPTETGTFPSQWRMSTPTGMYFGDMIWVIITVEKGGVLAVTQQLSSFGNGAFAQSPAKDCLQNPFASPQKPESSPIPLASPNSSIIAQQGSPDMAQFSPSPIPGRTWSGPVMGPVPSPMARSLFQTQGEQGGDSLDMGDDMS